MSGGPGHVLQALANLDIIRSLLKSSLPVEFWHAYELNEVHCEALAQMGAKCMALQVPGVYPLWQTTMPAILSSRFQEVLWIDTDITPLLDPAKLFETAAFWRDGALFWPDLWGAGCPGFGQSAWPQHVVWHLLDLRHNASDVRYTNEHEAGHLLVDKVRHWKPLVLANYLATRDFFTRVLHGYKDVFRLAWLKLDASGWLSSSKPGVVGAFMRDGSFFPTSLIHFWPPDGEEPVLGSPAERVPLYVHQKKKPGLLWQDVVTFPEPLGECTRYRLGHFHLEDVGGELWDVGPRHPALAEAFTVSDRLWNHVYQTFHEAFKSDPRMGERDVRRLHPEERREHTRQFKKYVMSCTCDYHDNRWLQVLSDMHEGSYYPETLDCDGLLRDDLHTRECPVGFVFVAVLCSNLFLRSGDEVRATRSALVVGPLLPAIAACLPHSFWPPVFPELEAFAAQARRAGDGAGAGPPPVWPPHRLRLREDTVREFPANLQRCVPLKDRSCWPGTRASGASDLDMCVFCCDPGSQAWRNECFSEPFTEARCCHAVEP